MQTTTRRDDVPVEYHLRKTDDPVVFLATRSTVSSAGRCVPDPEAAPVRVRLPCAPPFLSETCRYALVLRRDENLNNDVADVVGCAGIACSPDAFDPAAIARRALARRTSNLSLRLPKKDVPSYEKKLANVNAGLARLATPQKRVDALCGLIRANFRDDHEIEADVRDELSSSLGWFREAVDLRGLASTLFSVGFTDRRAIRDALASSSVSSSSSSSSSWCPSAWFVPLGHGTPDEFAESFAHIVERLSNDVNEIRRHLEDAVAADPVTFFHATTRPVPFRELGGIDPTLFADYCSRVLGVDVDATSLARVAGGHGDGANGNDVVANGCPPSSGAVARVHGVSLRRNAASVLRDFARLRAIGALEVVSETKVAAASRSRSDRVGGPLVAANYDVPGDADAIREVHVACATQKILIGFATGDACSRNDLKRRFLQRMGDKKSRVVDVYFRDAHLLSVDVLAHLVWRLRNRVTFGRVVLTHRFEGDVAYRGKAWDLISHFRTRDETTEPVVATDKDVTVDRIDRETLADVRGFCIVPTVRDVEALHPEDGRVLGGRGGRDRVDDVGSVQDEWVYAVEPPLFGRAEATTTTNGKRRNGIASLVVRYPHKKTKEWNEIVPVVSPTTNRTNARRCPKTRAGGVILPASSLAYYRERYPWAQGDATVFVPSALGPEWFDDTVAVARGFFKRVRVVRVKDPTYALDDSGGRSKTYERLVARVLEETTPAMTNYALG